MGKLLTLVFIILLTVASLLGYLYLSNKVIAGRQKIAEGQLQLDNGKKMLAQGRAKLESGKQRLARAKSTYKQFSGIPILNIVDKLPLTNMIFQNANKQIKDGQTLINNGELKVKSGTARLKEGEEDLNRGKKRLIQFNKIRIACAISTAFFAFLFFVLSFCWRRSLVSRSKCSK